MSARDRRLAAFFDGISDFDLRREFDSLRERPDCRVQSGPCKGQVRLSIARYGDKILSELRRRAAVRAKGGSA